VKIAEIAKIAEWPKCGKKKRGKERGRNKSQFANSDGEKRGNRRKAQKTLK